MISLLLRVWHDSLNRFLNESAQAIKAPVPFYSRKVLIALSACCFILLSNRSIGIPLFLIKAMSWTVFLGTVSLYGLLSGVGKNFIFNDIAQFLADLLRVCRQEQFFWPFFAHYILAAPYRCFGSAFQVLINPGQHILAPRTAMRLSSQILGSIIFFYGAAGFYGSLNFISLPVLKSVLFSQLILCAAFQFLAFSGRPDFWNEALDSFIAKPTLIDKINFLAMHIFIYPLSNFIHMLHFEHNRAFERHPIAPPIDADAQFPGAGAQINPAPFYRIAPHEQPLNQDQVRAARLNRFGIH